MLLAPGVIQFSKGKGRYIRVNVVAQPQRLVTARPPCSPGFEWQDANEWLTFADNLHVSAGREGGNWVGSTESVGGAVPKLRQPKATFGGNGVT